MPDYGFSIFSFFGAVLCIEPAFFSWRIPGRPWSVLFVMCWICIYNILSFVDSIIWSGENSAEWPDAQGYCDIDSRIKTVFPIGVLGAAIGVCRFLAESTDLETEEEGLLSRNKFRRNIGDVFLGVILPILFIVLHFIIEPSRYDIVGVTGCQSSVD